MLRRDSFICISCGRINFEGGEWSEIVSDSPSDVIKVLCPNCSHEPFPRLYSDFEKPKESFNKKILKGFFRKKEKG